MTMKPPNAQELLRQQEASKPTPVTPPKSPEQELKDYKSQMELESVKAGYASLKEREKSISDRELELQKGTELLAKDRDAFEVEQQTRVDKYNFNVAEFNKKFALLKTKLDNAQKAYETATEKQAEAEQILAAQSDAEKSSREKAKAYSENMHEALALLSDMMKCLRGQDEPKCLDLSSTLYKDLILIQRLQDRKAALSSMADIIAVDVDRIHEVCEHLQNGKKDYSKLLAYLFSCTDWLCEKLVITWTPNEGEGTLN